MVSLLRSVPARRLLTEQVPCLSIAVGLTDIFCHFHSFSLECLAFLATWGVLDFAAGGIKAAAAALVEYRAGGGQ